jgi:hypothetical protein
LNPLVQVILQPQPPAQLGGVCHCTQQKLEERNERQWLMKGWRDGWIGKRRAKLFQKELLQTWKTIYYEIIEEPVVGGPYWAAHLWGLLHPQPHWLLETTGKDGIHIMWRATLAPWHSTGSRVWCKEMLGIHIQGIFLEDYLIKSRPQITLLHFFFSTSSCKLKVLENNKNDY